MVGGTTWWLGLLEDEEEEEVEAHYLFTRGKEVEA
jgi:hypothetical protein